MVPLNWISDGPNRNLGVLRRVLPRVCDKELLSTKLACIQLSVINKPCDFRPDDFILFVQNSGYLI